MEGPTTFHLYAYTPSLAAAIIFIILFALTTTLHTYQLIKTRAWYLIPIAIGGLCTYLSLSLFPCKAPVVNGNPAVEFIGYIEVRNLQPTGP